LLLFTSGQGGSWADRMIYFVPTGVFDCPFTVNNLPLELDLVRALLPQVHVVIFVAVACRAPLLSLRVLPGTPCSEGRSHRGAVVRVEED